MDRVSESLSYVAQSVSSKTVKIQNGSHYFSGALVGSDGYILTLKTGFSRQSESLRVRTFDGQIYKGKVIKTWPLYGLALIKIEAVGLPFFLIGDSSTVEIADQVLSCGNAFNAARGAQTLCGVHFGVISGRRPFNIKDFYYQGDVFLTDARMNPGSEGGPLTDLNGHLVGVNGQAVVAEETNAHVSLALPLEKISKELKKLLNVPALPFPDPVVRVHGRSFGTGGVLVKEVSEVAMRADIRLDDLLTHVGGREVNHFQDFSSRLLKGSVGRLLPVSLYRNGKFLRRYLPYYFNSPVENMLMSEVYRQAITKVSPLVVQLHVKRGNKKKSFDYEELPPDQRAFQLGRGPFTGIIYRSDGYLLTTSFNLAGDVHSVVAELADGRKFPAEILGRDYGRNITLLKIQARNLPEPKRVNSHQLQVGTTILALGRTYAKEGLPTIDRGILSALNRSAGKAVQIDANLNPGNFGGPTIDLEGHVLGVNIPQANMDTFAHSTAGGQFSGSGIGFVVLLEDIDRLFSSLKKGEDLEPAFLGIRFRNDPSIVGAEISAIIQEVGLPKRGVTLQDLKKAAQDRDKFNSLHTRQPTGAFLAGLRPGDIIKTFNGKIIPGWNVLLNSIGQLNAGESVHFEIERSGEMTDVSAILGPRGRILP